MTQNFNILELKKSRRQKFYFILEPCSYFRSVKNLTKKKKKRKAPSVVSYIFTGTLYIWTLWMHPWVFTSDWMERE